MTHTTTKRKSVGLLWFKICNVVESCGLEEIGSGLLLLIATCVSLILSNSSFAPTYIDFWKTPFTVGFGEHSLTMSLRDLINDALMSLFFFVVALEIRKEIFFGALRSFGKAILPVVSAIGGMIVPAGMYFFFNKNTVSANGWGIPTATDIAFAVGVLTIFRKRIPAVMLIFLLTLAIADDMGAIMLIACFYGKTLNFSYVICSLLITGVLALMGYFYVYRGTSYFIVGALLWYCLFRAGINPDIAGVVTAFCVPVMSKIQARGYVKNIEKLCQNFMPEDNDCQPQRSLSQEKILKNMVSEIKNVHSPLQRLTARWHNFAVFFVMPLFALANTSIPISLGDIKLLTSELSSIGIIIGLTIGKPLGIAGFAFIATKIGLAKLPSGLSWKYLVIAGMVGGIGFTMSLFIAELSFSDEYCLKIAKLSVLTASMLSALIATICIFTMTKKRQSGS